MNLAVAEIEPSGWARPDAAYDYSLYGLRIRIPIKLNLPELPEPGSIDTGSVHITFVAEPVGWFASATSNLPLDPDDWVHQYELAGGWSYIRYDELFDFLVSPAGDRIFYRRLGPFSAEAFQTYALGRVVSFALVKLGMEPLHAATVVVEGRAVAFLGASTYGKSSLAACFVAAGHALLTDDVLRLQDHNGGYLAFPGPPHLKLFPKIACLFLGEKRCGGLEMKPGATKRVFPLTPQQSWPFPAQLAAIYVISAPRDVHSKQQISIQPLSPMEALLKILSFTHNDRLTGRNRLERQFSAARRMLDACPVQKLSYPRVLSSLPQVRERVLADLQTRTQP